MAGIIAGLVRNVVTIKNDDRHFDELYELGHVHGKGHKRPGSYDTIARTLADGCCQPSESATLRVRHNDCRSDLVE